MSEYKAKQDETTRIWRVYDVIGGVVAVGHTSSQELAIILNDETAALRQQIADLQAENAKLKADCVSYEKVLNDVAIGYLEATEKLKEVEAQESPVIAEIAPIAEEKPKKRTLDNLRNSKSNYQGAIVDSQETIAGQLAAIQDAARRMLEPKETRVRVNWSGNGFSSGSYKLVSSFGKFGRNWHTIEVITDKVMQYTVNAEKCEVVL